jgi:glycine/D-amino acid oxidase-like deaminating enzyme
MLGEPARTQEDSCDVIIVGAGLVGAAVAARLAHEGYKTAVLEARQVAAGATGQSSGMVLTGLSGHYNWAISVYGREQARELWALTIGGRERLVEAAMDLKVPVERSGSLQLALDEEEATALRESAEFLREDGFDAWFGRGDPLERNFIAALRQPDDVTVDAASLTQALLAESGVIVHEGTEVHRLEPIGDEVRIWAPRRMAQCRAVVLTVNGYAPLIHDYFINKVIPVRGFAFRTRPATRVTLEQPCISNYGRACCRQLPNKQLVLSSCGGQGLEGDNETDEGMRKRLTRFAADHFPEADLSNAEQLSAIRGFTPDGLPLLGTLPDLPQVYFAVGFGGRGMAWAFVVADYIVDKMLGRSDLGPLSTERLET